MIWSLLTRRKRLLGLSVVCAFLMFLGLGSASGQCAASDPTGLYKGSATSGQAGQLELTLNLRCDKGSYAGSLGTSVGKYTVVSGSFTDGVLKLDMTYAGNHIAVTLKRSGDDFEGTFNSADDSGPVKLHRTSDAVAADPK